ncbi:MAG: winged helix-turn-helix transcriptional regulator [Planctomycetales bacterium]|nr:winged helix-turn-helix transcriptional regulator [Planctomycetales bacterium]
MASPSTPNHCASMLKVLADETRLAVVERLFDGALHVGEINARLQVEPTLLSHHLKVLREAGIVEAQRDGRAVLYRLAPSAEAARSGRGLDLGCCRIMFD